MPRLNEYNSVNKIIFGFSGGGIAVFYVSFFKR
jgi:hypothetical protein